MSVLVNEKHSQLTRPMTANDSLQRRLQCAVLAFTKRVHDSYEVPTRGTRLRLAYAKILLRSAMRWDGAAVVKNWASLASNASESAVNYSYDSFGPTLWSLATTSGADGMIPADTAEAYKGARSFVPVWHSCRLSSKVARFLMCWLASCHGATGLDGVEAKELSFVANIAEAVN